MQRTPPVKERLVFVHWLDSATERGWKDFRDVVPKPTLCASVGWVIEDNADGLTIVPSISFEHEDDSIRSGFDALTIPRGAIVRIKAIPRPT